MVKNFQKFLNLIQKFQKLEGKFEKFQVSII